MKNAIIEKEGAQTGGRVSATRPPQRVTRGFVPAFCDGATGRQYLSRRADGTLAMVHLIEGLPDELITQRDTDGRPVAIKESVVSGFVCDGKFYTREEADNLLSTPH